MVVVSSSSACARVPVLVAKGRVCRRRWGFRIRPEAILVVGGWYSLDRWVSEGVYNINILGSWPWGLNWLMSRLGGGWRWVHISVYSFSIKY